MGGSSGGAIQEGLAQGVAGLEIRPWRPFGQFFRGDRATMNQDRHTAAAMRAFQIRHRVANKLHIVGESVSSTGWALGDVSVSAVSGIESICENTAKLESG